MTATPEYNAARLAALESRLVVLSGAARGIADAANEATDFARSQALHARRLSLFDAAPSASLSELLAQHCEELERLGTVGNELHARKVHQCRSVVGALRSAISAGDQAQGLRNEADAAAAVAAPLKTLVKRCRVWAGLDGDYIPVGKTEQ